MIAETEVGPMLLGLVAWLAVMGVIGIVIYEIVRRGVRDGRRDDRRGSEDWRRHM